MRQRIEIVCPICGKSFIVDLEISTYVTAETTIPSTAKRDISTVLRGREAKVDFVLRAMRALASKEPSGMVEVGDIVDIAEKVGLTRDVVNEILEAEKNAGRIYEAKPGLICFTVPPEYAKI